MKRITFILIAAMTFILFSCSPIKINYNPDKGQQDTNVTQAPQFKCSEIADKIIADFDLSKEAFDTYDFNIEDAKLDEGTISLFYGGINIAEQPDFSHVTDYCVMIPNTTTATEMGFFKVDNASAAKNIEAYLLNRTSSRATTFAPYNEDESKKAENAKISSYENYVWYIVTDNNREIEGTILKLIKGEDK